MVVGYDGDFVLFFHAEVGLSGFQIEADFSALQFGAEDLLGLFFYFLGNGSPQLIREIGSSIVDTLVGGALRAPLF